MSNQPTNPFITNGTAPALPQAMSTPPPASAAPMPLLPPTAATTRQPRPLEEEFSAMEAVRELLFGRRMAEFQKQLASTTETWQSHMEKLEASYKGQLAEILAATRTELGSLRTHSFRELETLGNALGESRTAHENKARDLDQVVKQLAESQKMAESVFQGALMKLDAKMDRGLSSLHQELAQMRQTMPTTEDLAGLFRAMAERMRSGLAEEGAPEINRRSQPTETAVSSDMALSG